jgi:hypothetical protein
MFDCASRCDENNGWRRLGMAVGTHLRTRLLPRYPAPPAVRTLSRRARHCSWPRSARRVRESRSGGSGFRDFCRCFRPGLRGSSSARRGPFSPPSGVRVPTNGTNNLTNGFPVRKDCVSGPWTSRAVPARKSASSVDCSHTEVRLVGHGRSIVRPARARADPVARVASSGGRSTGCRGRRHSRLAESGAAGGRPDDAGTAAGGSAGAAGAHAPGRSAGAPTRSADTACTRPVGSTPGRPSYV